MQALGRHLGVDPERILATSDPETGALAGYVLPLLPVLVAGELCWSSCIWEIPTARVELISGDSPIGYRLPLHLLPEVEELATEAIFDLDRAPTQAPSAPVDSPPNSIRIAVGVQAALQE
jgi:uncharacterized protein (DUF2126 family)